MNTDKITAEEMVIIDRLKQMKMSGMAEAYEEQLLNPNIDLTSFFTRFSNIVNFECVNGIIKIPTFGGENSPPCYALIYR